MPKPKLAIRVELQRGRLGPGKVELLERIGSSGSLAAAAREMDMSYKRAWELLAVTNELFGREVAIAHPGRNTSGATELTPFGRRLIQSYRVLEGQLEAAATPVLRQLERWSVQAHGRTAAASRKRSLAIKRRKS